MNMRNDEQSVR